MSTWEVSGECTVHVLVSTFSRGSMSPDPENIMAYVAAKFISRGVGSYKFEITSYAPGDVRNVPPYTAATYPSLY